MADVEKTLRDKLISLIATSVTPIPVRAEYDTVEATKTQVVVTVDAENLNLKQTGGGTYYKTRCEASAISYLPADAGASAVNSLFSSVSGVWYGLTLATLNSGLSGIAVDGITYTEQSKKLSDEFYWRTVSAEIMLHTT